MCRRQLSRFFVSVCPCLFSSAPLCVSVFLCLQPFSYPMSPLDGFFCSCVSPSVPLIPSSTSLVLSTLITPNPLSLILHLSVHLHLASTLLPFISSYSGSSFHPNCPFGFSFLPMPFLSSAFFPPWVFFCVTWVFCPKTQWHLLHCPFVLPLCWSQKRMCSLKRLLWFLSKPVKGMG